MENICLYLTSFCWNTLIVMEKKCFTAGFKLTDYVYLYSIYAHRFSVCKDYRWWTGSNLTLYKSPGQTTAPSFSLLLFIRATYSSKSVNTSLIQLLLSTVWWICTVFQEPSDRKLYFNLADGEGSSANNVRIRFVTGKSLHLQAHY